MSESVGDVEDWSLQAIVRGSSGEFGKIEDMEMDGQDLLFDQHHHHRRHSQFDGDIFTSFRDILEGSSDELEDLYKPFYYTPTTTAAATITSCFPDQTVVEFQEQTLTSQDKPSPNPSPPASPVPAAVTPLYTPKYKKR